MATTTFGALEIDYDDNVLEPRLWTVMQSEWAAELLSDLPPGPFLELCSGAGQIGLLAARLSGRSLVAVDISPTACDHIRRNAASAGLTERVVVRHADLSSALLPGEQFALVVADPPWVRTGEVDRYPEDPVLAIDGGRDGMTVAHAIVLAAAGHVPPGGSLLMQLGDADQAADVTETARAHGWVAAGLRRGERGVVQRLIAG